VNWLKIVAIVILLLGLGGGGFLAAQRPTFWLGIAGAIFEFSLPVLAKRMPPEKEAEMLACIRRAGQWDNIKKRCKG
jgi:cyanate permease